MSKNQSVADCLFASCGEKNLRYAFYLLFHPFKGFWDIKHEKKREAC